LPRKIGVVQSTVAFQLRLLVLCVLVLRTFDLSLDLPDDSLVHYVVNVSSALTENVVCSGFENTDNKVSRIRLKPSLGDGDLEC